MPLPQLQPTDVPAIIELAWSHPQPFVAAQTLYALEPDALKRLMKRELRWSSYHLWCRKVGIEPNVQKKQRRLLATMF